MKFKICKNKKIEALYNEAMQADLKHWGGGFESVKDKLDKVICAVGLYKDGKIIGFGMTTQDGALSYAYNIGVYIDRAHMGNGYGTKTVLTMIKATKKIKPDYEPCYSNERFYKKVLGR
jgi:RimJ/RimL family protein N-acetyltransferase